MVMDDADELLQIQLCSRVASDSTPSDLSNSEREKLLHENAVQVEHAIECFDTGVCWMFDISKHTKHLDHGPHLFPSERARFTHLYYRIWILAVASPEERADRLAKTDLREHFCLFDLLRWACTMLNPEDYDYVGMHPGLRDGSLLNEQQEYMQALHRQHLKLDDTWTYTPGPPLPDDRVLDCWAVFDHCQSVLDGVPGSLTPIEGPSPQCQQAIKSVADQEPSAAEDAKSALAPK